MLKHLKLRKELFWDIDPEKLDEIKNRRIIVERVLTLGEIDEFLALIHFYDKKTLLKEISEIAYLDPKTLQFVISYFGINQDDLKCCTKTQLQKTR